MKVRSPVLGYNHNIRYAGRLWHVQTEDSGVNNPHLFTHLFHAGTILATKRFDYDPTSDVEVVQKFMQSQHKAMLRDLKRGAFDEKIAKFLGEPVEKVRAIAKADPVTSDQTPSEPLNLKSDDKLDTDPSAPTLIEEPARAAASAPSTVEASPEPPTVAVIQAPNKQAATKKKGADAARRPRPVLRRSPELERVRATPVSRAAARRSPRTASAAQAPTAEGVIVARPNVVVGGGAEVVARQARHTRPIETAKAKPSPRTDTIFGAAPTSEKSLDEVILAYLSDDVTDKG